MRDYDGLIKYNKDMVEKIGTMTFRKIEERVEKCRCLSCGKVVEVKLTDFGGAYVADCPECKKLAYNGDGKEGIIV